MTSSVVARPTRLLGLDVARGLTLAFMIMVNNNGGPGSWHFMNHAEWNGLTPTDLVFPTFVFIVGASIVFALRSRLARGATRAELLRHTLTRTAVLIAFGIIVNGFPFFHLDHLRFYGVLQRIAVAYCAVSLFQLFDRRLWTKVAAITVLLVGYWLLLVHVPVPGAGLPGRDVQLLDPDQNIVSWLDRQLMPGHLYENWTEHNQRDPEGLLSDLPAIATALLGLLAGLWLATGRPIREKVHGLAAGAFTLLLLGYGWAHWLPLNKKLWTSSYTLVAAGWSALLLTVVFWLVDERRWGGRWTVPFLVLGSNAIFAYMFSELLPGALGPVQIAGRPFFLRWLDLVSVTPLPGVNAFLFSLSFLAVCMVPVAVLYRKKIFLKI